MRAFRALGAFAVGIDLQPLFNLTNMVLEGNALDMQFADESIDRVYSNVIDHIPRLPAFAAEVMRVLKPGGVLWLDVRCQARAADPWAVRTTGSPEFYAELAAAMTSAKLQGSVFRMLRKTSHRRPAGTLMTIH